MEKLKVGDKVRTPRGTGEIVFILDEGVFPYLVGIHGYDGHSGGPYEEYAKARGYVRECMWACAEEVVKIKRTKKKRTLSEVCRELGFKYEKLKGEK